MFPLKRTKGRSDGLNGNPLGFFMFLWSLIARGAFGKLNPEKPPLAALFNLDAQGHSLFSCGIFQVQVIKMRSNVRHYAASLRIKDSSLGPISVQLTRCYMHLEHRTQQLQSRWGQTGYCSATCQCPARALGSEKQFVCKTHVCSSPLAPGCQYDPKSGG